MLASAGRNFYAVLLRCSSYTLIVAAPFLPSLVTRFVDHIPSRVQLAKLIVNSGGAAALVDYVADAQVSEQR